MNLVVSIKNVTKHNATLTVVKVQGAQWVFTQELTVGQSIVSGDHVVGMLDTGLPFSGQIIVHYPEVVWVGPLPGSDVTIDFSRQRLGGEPRFATYAPAFPQTDTRLAEDEDNRILMVDIQE